MEYNNRFEDNIESDFDFKAFFDRYIIHWKWFVLSVVAFLFVAFFYLRYTIPQYKALTTILVKDDTKGGMASELSAFADMGIGTGIKSNLDNEIEVLKSRTLVESTVRNLNLNVSLIKEGQISDREIYYDTPITVKYVSNSIEPITYSLNFIFNEISSTTFTLEAISTDPKVSSFFNHNKKFHYDEVIKSIYGTILVTRNAVENRVGGKPLGPLQLNIEPIETVVNSFVSRLDVSALSKTSTVVTIAVTDPITKKAEVFLDNLVQLYNENAATDKNFISENTSKFIAGRLVLITEELDGVEQDVESFKKSNKITDVQSEASIFVEGANEYDKKGVETDIQLSVVSSLLDYIKKSSKADLLPANIISQDQGDASGLINSYNELVLNRNKILKSATAENPMVVKVDQEITSLKSNIQSNLLRLKSSLDIQKRSLNNQEGLFNAKINKIPVQEREFRSIERQQKVKEELYLYLLQKREETAISLAATEPNARVIDSARANKLPVSPNKRIVYLACLLLGLLIPFGIIYTDDLLDTKIKSRLDLDGKVQIPFIGDVPTSDDSSHIMKSDSRSSSAEALRIVRTNLEFMLNKVEEGKAKTIFVTSTFPKEGKTFISVNLAATFALSGKKVLLVGMDIRNPRLDEYLKLPERGFTNYLSSKDLKIEDLIVKYEGYEDFYILPAGVIPPNPAELLMSKKVTTFFETVKNQFDYIIVDTAPVSLVTDTLLIAKNADCFVYVARANFLEKRMLNIPITLYKENKIPNMCILLNDTDSTKGYGYGYGYGSKVEKKSFFNKIFKS